MNKKINTVINLAFVGLIIFVLAAGLIMTVFFPREKNHYENRKAEKIKAFSVSAYLDKSFQDSIDAALADNVPFAEQMKMLYNMTNSSFINKSVETAVVMDKESGLDYISLGNTFLYGEYLVYKPGKLEWQKGLLDERFKIYNSMAEKYKDVEFYAYYIEKDTDIDFNTGDKVGTYEYIKKNLKFPEKNIARFEITDFDTFTKSYYKTDHHWNANGSYRGYTDLLKLLSAKGEPIKVKEQLKIDGVFAGAKTREKTTASYSEEFFVNRYDFPEMVVTINGYTDAGVDYGQQNFYKDESGTLVESAAYTEYYGGDFGEIIFDMNAPEKENILLIGESYDNAVLKLLATHFNKTHSVDMRYYLAYMGQEFDFESYIKNNDIDKVLFIGALDYFTSDIFVPEK